MTDDRRLTPEVEAQVEAQMTRQHDDYRRGEMTLAYTKAMGTKWGDPGVLRNTVPTISQPRCYHDDCEMAGQPELEWPADCTCIPHETHSRWTRYWVRDCPAHGVGSTWSWLPDVMEWEEERKHARNTDDAGQVEVPGQDVPPRSGKEEA